MNESAARKVLLLQALETEQPALSLWGEEDGAWASRTALTDLAAKGNFQSYIVRRAEYAFQRINAREPVLANWLTKRFWHSRWIFLAVPLGLLMGIFINSIGSNQHVNLLDPPLLAVVLWNIFTYILLLGHLIKTLMSRSLKPGVLIGLTQRALRSSGLNSIGFSSNGIIQIVQSFENLWLYCSSPLFTARASTLLHGLSASIALGLIAGLYLRGLVFDYRAAWESTFLGANSVHQILSFVLAPAIAISHITMPDVAALDAMRIVHGSKEVGVSAAPWIHLYSLTLLLIIVLPRTALMLWSMLRSYWIAHHMTVPLDNDYFKRLMRQYGGDTPPKSLRLGLISHTKAAKTNFISSLLGLNVEDINDTHELNKLGSVYSIIETPHSEELLLWDAPDVRETTRISKQPHKSKTLLSWFSSEVWDRWLDREFWDDQQIALNIRKDADILLYLVNVKDSPDFEEYLPNELELLKWLEKPIIVLLNQTQDVIEREVSKIKFKNAYLANQKHVKAILTVDEITKCWIQKDKLFQAIENVLDGERRLLMARLRTAYETISTQNFNASVRLLAKSLARIANDFELLPESQKNGVNLKRYGAVIGIGDNSDSDTKYNETQEELNVRLETEIRENIYGLIVIHGFDDKTYQDVHAPLARQFDVRSRLNEGEATFWGGVLTGALTGLSADVLSGGLTLGTGAIAGAVIGAFGAKGFARGVNIVRGNNQSRVMWSTETLNQMLEALLLRYIVVIHCDHMKDTSTQADSISRWIKLIQQFLIPHHQAVSEIWKLRSENGENKVEAEQLIASQLEPIITKTLRSVLHEIYPSMTKI